MTTDMISAMKAEADDAPEVAVSRDRYGYRVNGQFLRRVTTLVGGIPKPWLGSWAAKEVAEFAVAHRESWQDLPATDATKLLKGAPWSKRDDAGDRGTAVHKAIEAYVRHEPVPEGMTEDEAACAEAARQFLDLRASRPLASELTVYSLRHGYAGTMDLWDMDIDGVSWILDWKTSSGVYPEYAIQLSAYRNAEFALVRKKAVPGKDEQWTGRAIPWGPLRAEKLGIVHVTPEKATLYPIKYTDRLWRVFRAAAFVKAWQLDTDSSFGKTPRENVFEEAR